MLPKPLRLALSRSLSERKSWGGGAFTPRRSPRGKTPTFLAICAMSEVSKWPDGGGVGGFSVRNHEP